MKILKVKVKEKMRKNKKLNSLLPSAFIDATTMKVNNQEMQTNNVNLEKIVNTSQVSFFD